MKMMKHFRFIFYIVAIACFSSAFADPRVDLFRALNLDHASVVRDLLMLGIDPNVRDDKGQQALLVAMRDGSFRSAELLLRMPILKVDATNPAHETALMIAALHGYTDWCERLLDRGAAPNRDGWTPLHYAAAGPQPKTVALLIARGAAVNARAPNGNTPLMMAAMYGQEETVALLLAQGADRNLRNAAGRSAADLAHAAGRDFLIPMLEEASR